MNVSRALLTVALLVSGFEGAQADPRGLCNGGDSPATPTVTTASPTSTPETTPPATTAAPTTSAPPVTPTQSTVAPTTAPVTPAPTTPVDDYCSPGDASYSTCVAALSKSTALEPNTDFTALVTWQPMGLKLWECIDSCAAQAGCLGYTYNTKLSWCYQFAYLGEKYEWSSGVTGTILAPKSSCSLSLDTEFVGLNLSNAGAESSEECCLRCQQTTGCNAFTFTTDSLCQLKTSAAGKQTKQYYTSGVVAATP